MHLLYIHVCRNAYTCRTVTQELSFKLKVMCPREDQLCFCFIHIHPREKGISLSFYFESRINILAAFLWFSLKIQ